MKRVVLSRCPYGTLDQHLRGEIECEDNRCVWKHPNEPKEDNAVSLSAATANRLDYKSGPKAVLKALEGDKG